MRRFGQRLWIAVLFGAVLLPGCSTVPSAPPVSKVMSAEERVVHNLRVFDRAWELVNDKFFDAKFRGVDWPAMRPRYRPEAEKAQDDDALYAILNRMLGELKESHNYAMSPQIKFESETHQRARVGIGFQRLEGRWVVTEVMPASPAEEAGVKPGWLITARNGQPMDQPAASTARTGESLVYQFLDERDQPRTVTMTARDLSFPDRMEVRELADGAVYLRFDGFDSKSRRWLRDQLKLHWAAPAVVVDLRHNHGGLFLSLEFALGEFFPDAVPLGTFIRRSGAQREKDTWQLLSARYGGRVALLVDQQTASCGEIFADAMRYHHRAVVVGRKTIGAVVVALYYSLPDGGRMQLAVEDFRALDGRRLEGVGVTPDKTVPLRLADIRAGRDADLEVALEELRSLDVPPPLR